MTNANQSVALNLDLSFCFATRQDQTVRWFAERALEACMKKFFIATRGIEAWKALGKSNQEDLTDGSIPENCPKETAILIAQMILPHLTTDEVLDALNSGEWVDTNKRGAELIEKLYPAMVENLMIEAELKKAVAKFDKNIATEKRDAERKFKRGLNQTIRELENLGYVVNRRAAKRPVFK